MVQLVAEAGTGDHLRAHVERDRHQQVVVDFLLVVGDDLVGFDLGPLDVEVGHQADLLVLQHASERFGCHRLGEGPRQRCHEDQFGVPPDPLLLQPPVGQEDELEGCHRALKGHLGDVHHQLAPLEGAEMLGKVDRSFEGVEGVDVVGTSVSELLESGGLVGTDVGAGGYDQEVVVEPAIAVQAYPVLVRLDVLDLGVDHLDPGRDEVPFRFDHVAGGVHPEGNEEETRLVVVILVVVDDGDLPLLRVEPVTELVDHHGAGRSGPEDQEFLHR